MAEMFILSSSEQNQGNNFNCYRFEFKPLLLLGRDLGQSPTFCSSSDASEKTGFVLQEKHLYNLRLLEKLAHIQWSMGGVCKFAPPKRSFRQFHCHISLPWVSRFFSELNGLPWAGTEIANLGGGLWSEYRTNDNFLPCISWQTAFLEHIHTDSCHTA